MDREMINETNKKLKHLIKNKKDKTSEDGFAD